MAYNQFDEKIELFLPERVFDDYCNYLEDEERDKEPLTIQEFIDLNYLKIGDYDEVEDIFNQELEINPRRMRGNELFDRDNRCIL